MFKAFIEIYSVITGNSLTTTISRKKAMSAIKEKVQKIETTSEKAPLIHRSDSPTTILKKLEQRYKKCNKFITIFLAISWALGMSTAETWLNMENLSAMSMDEFGSWIIANYTMIAQNRTIPQNTTVDSGPSALRFFRKAWVDETAFNKFWLNGGFAVLSLTTFLGMVPFNGFDSFMDAKNFLKKYCSWCNKIKNNKQPLRKDHWTLQLATGIDSFLKYTILAGGGGINIGQFFSGSSNTLYNFSTIFTQLDPIPNSVWWNVLCFLPFGYFSGGLPIANATIFLGNEALNNSYFALDNLLASCSKNSWYGIINDISKTGNLSHEDKLTPKQINRALQLMTGRVLQGTRFLDINEFKVVGITSKDTSEEILAKFLVNIKVPLWKPVIGDLGIPILMAPFSIIATEQFYHNSGWWADSLTGNGTELTPWIKTPLQVLGQGAMFLLWWILVARALAKILKWVRSNPVGQEIKWSTKQWCKWVGLKALDVISIVASFGVSMTNFALFDYTSPFFSLATNIVFALVVNTVFSMYGLVDGAKRALPQVVPKSESELLQGLLQYVLLNDIRKKGHKFNKDLYKKIRLAVKHQFKIKEGKAIVSKFFNESKEITFNDKNLPQKNSLTREFDLVLRQANETKSPHDIAQKIEITDEKEVQKNIKQIQTNKPDDFKKKDSDKNIYNEEHTVLRIKM